MELQYCWITQEMEPPSCREPYGSGCTKPTNQPDSFLPLVLVARSGSSAISPLLTHPSVLISGRGQLLAITGVPPWLY